MEKQAEVNVLGTKYTIYTKTTEVDKPYMKDADGVCDYTTKSIYIADLEDGDPLNYGHMPVYERRTVRHELVHAFLFESGLDHNAEWARNEEIVDWIAIQFPKLAKVYESIRVES